MTEGTCFTSTCTCFVFLIVIVLKFHFISGVYMFRGLAVESLGVYSYGVGHYYTRDILIFWQRENISLLEYITFCIYAPESN